MPLYIKNPIVIEATRWFKNGDHPLDGDPNAEGKVVRCYKSLTRDGHNTCNHCGKIMLLHGWVDTLEGGHIVCPGDYVITGVKGEIYPCKPDIFEETYSLAEGQQPGDV